MQLRVAGDLPASLIEQLRQDLSPFLPIVLERMTILQQGHLPAEVRLIADRTEWTMSLKGPARTLLINLSEEGGLGSSSDKARIAKALSDADVEPLKKIAQTLCSVLAKQSQMSLLVGVGLAVPEWNHSTTLRFPNADEESVALALARFVDHLPDVESALREEIRGPRKPYGHVQLDVAEKGPIFLRWLDEKDLNYQEREVTPKS